MTRKLSLEAGATAKFRAIHQKSGNFIKNVWILKTLTGSKTHREAVESASLNKQVDSYSTIG
jgi:hypothetical protein